jgi:hypothetical protein
MRSVPWRNEDVAIPRRRGCRCCGRQLGALRGGACNGAVLLARQAEQLGEEHRVLEAAVR